MRTSLGNARQCFFGRRSNREGVVAHATQSLLDILGDDALVFDDEHGVSGLGIHGVTSIAKVMSNLAPGARVMASWPFNWSTSVATSVRPRELEVSMSKSSARPTPSSATDKVSCPGPCSRKDTW